MFSRTRHHLVCALILVAATAAPIKTATAASIDIIASGLPNFFDNFGGSLQIDPNDIPNPIIFASTMPFTLPSLSIETFYHGTQVFGQADIISGPPQLRFQGNLDGFLDDVVFRLDLGPDAFVQLTFGETGIFNLINRRDALAVIEINILYTLAPQPSSIPEPGTGLLLASGLVGLAVRRRARAC